jgi:dTDP-glucose 4,6-dehydratase
MKTFVTGGAGVIGSALVLHLIHDLGHEILSVDTMTYAANPTSLASLNNNPKHRLVEADICDAPRIRALMS